MKRILLLGGYGFIGSNLLKFIDEHLSSDYSVIVFDRYQVHPFGMSFKCVEKAYTGDFGDFALMESIFQQHKITSVIHLISTTVPSTSIDARFDIESNLLPTIELLNLMVKYNVNRIVFLSSGGAIYGNSNNNRKHREIDNLFPISSYGIVKLTIEKYLYQYTKLTKIRTLILRVSNPYGIYHYSEKQGVINIALRAAMSGQTFKVWGDGKAVKDFIFITDLCDILFRLLDKNEGYKILNVGSGNAVSLNHIFEEIKRSVPGFVYDYGEPSKYDVTHFEIDNSELLREIGTFNFLPLQKGIRKTLDWLIDSETSLKK